MREGACTSFWRRDGWSNGSTTFTRPFCPPIAILHPSTVFLHPPPQAARPTLRHNLPLGVTHPSAFRITVSSCVHRAYFHEPGQARRSQSCSKPLLCHVPRGEHVLRLAFLAWIYQRRGETRLLSLPIALAISGPRLFYYKSAYTTMHSLVIRLRNGFLLHVMNNLLFTIRILI